MKKKITLSILLLFATFFSGQAQVFWSDTFEDTGAPFPGTRNAENNTGTGSPYTAYFARTNNAGINTVNSASGGYLLGEGAKFWAGENHDDFTGTTVVGTEEQEINWTGINISGKSNLAFRGLFAANNTSAAFETLALGSSHSDYVIVEYRIDGGSYLPLLRFYGNNATTSGANNKSLALDTDANNIGDGTILTSSFQEFEKLIPSTGTTLDIRIRCFMNGGNEEWAVDNFRVLELATCTAPTITSNPPNRTICASNNTTFSVAATGATSYQWQVNTGSGFTDLSNGAPYSNVTTNTLSITGVTTGMNGYLYRCVTYNGPITCFTNSNSGTLTVSNPSLTPASQTNIACNGAATGAASVNAATGGTGGYTYNWTPGNPTGDGTTSVTGLTAGTWTCTVTDSNSCTTFVNFNITQPTALALTPASQTNIACNGGATGAATVNTPTGGAGGYTYNWTPGNPTGDGTTSVSGLTAGTWTCTVTDANSCTKFVNFTITQPAAIDNNVTLSNGILQAIEAGATYQWYLCPNTIITQNGTNQTYIPTVLGDYKVVISSGGCTVTSNCITVATLGNKSFETNSKFVLYPNPSSGIININSETDGVFHIINQLGQTVKTFKVNANSVNSVNIENLTDGVYFVNDTYNKQSHKLIIKK